MKKNYSGSLVYGKNFTTGQVFTNAPELEKVIRTYQDMQEKQDGKQNVEKCRQAVC